VRRFTGHIINIGSTAAAKVYPNGMYIVLQNMRDALNQGMRNGLIVRNKSSYHPSGMVQTEFSEVRFKGDTDRAEKSISGFMPLQPEDIADIIHFVVETVSYQHCRFSSNEYCTGFFYDYKRIRIFIATINCTVSHKKI
jgi:NADP-dependent 3-hydroxy acid dehydrogenase YdfG